MEYRKLGKAGVKVSPLCLGVGIRREMDEDLFINSVHRAMDLGCNFIDCANSYGEGQSEVVLGKAIKGKRDDLVITSKVCPLISHSACGKIEVCHDITLCVR